MSVASRVESSASPMWNRAFLVFLPITVLDLVLFVAPMVVMGIASVLVIHEFNVSLELTDRNYLFLLASPIYLRILGRTILISLAVTAICLVLAYPFAYLLTTLPRRVRGLMLVSILLPFWTSYLLRVYAWITILGEHGLINSGLVNLGIVSEPVRFLLYNNYAIVIVSVYLYLPYAALALYTALERLDTSLFSAAMDLGARPFKVFQHVMLPLTLPGIFASFIFVFIPMMGEYVTPTLVGGVQGQMIVNIVVSQFRGLRFGVGSAMVFVICAIILVLILVLRKAAKLERLYGG